MGVFVALCGALWCLFGTSGGLGDPLWHRGFPFLHTWGAVGSLLGTLVRPWGFISAPWGSIWVPLGSMVVSCGHFLSGPGPIVPLLWKMLKKGTQHGRRNGDKFNDILSFRRKWQTAFGLRLCSRIRVRAPCFHSLGLPWCPWNFQCCFYLFLDDFGTLF